MSLLNETGNLPKGWLAFELNVLRRLKFGTVVLPFVGEPALGIYLKRWGIRVLANDSWQSAWTKAVAQIQNNAETLTEAQMATVLEDAYVPHHKLFNGSLRNWFSETDAWWFDNVRENIERLDSPFARAVALTIGMAVGDYVLSFDADTMELRQPLSHVFRRVWNAFPAPVNNQKNNSCHNKDARTFLAENHGDLMFLRLPRAHNLSLKASLGFTAWREDWVRGTGDFWESFEHSQIGRLGTKTETKSQYLRLVEDNLQTASHIQTWAITHAEDGFVTTQELIETISRIRRVDTIYTKDFSELSGAKAVIITA